MLMKLTIGRPVNLLHYSFDGFCHKLLSHTMGSPKEEKKVEIEEERKLYEHEKFKVGGGI
jgi:hypothetical protein